MIRKNFYLSKEQVNFLTALKDVTISEHIRRAVDHYIHEKKKANVITSPSKTKYE